MEIELPDLSKRTIDYIFLGFMFFILILGGIATYNHIEYAKELRSHPCILCKNLGYHCLEPYKQNTSWDLTDFYLKNDTEI